MSRPGYVLEVDNKSPSTLFWRGTEFTTEALSAGSRVVYAPESGVVLIDPLTAIDDALADPVGCDALAARIGPDTVLTVVFDDNVAPLFSTTIGDGRAEAIEAVLEIAASAGTDDVLLVVARGLNRRMTENELRQAVGERVYDSFAPKGWLTQHDAENSELLRDGLNKRVVDSDLVVYVNLAVTAKDCGWDKLACGIADRRRHDISALGAELRESTDVFAISITIDTSQFPSNLTFVSRREPQWRVRDKFRAGIATSLSRAIPPRFARQVMRCAEVPRRITGVNAGTIDDVAELTRKTLYAQTTTEIAGQADVVAFGLPSYFPSGVGETQDPISAAYGALGVVLDMHTGKPIVRDGGAMLLHHPMRPEFHTARRPSYIDFFNEGLDDPETCEIRLGDDAWLAHLYSNGYAEHALSPIRKWQAVTSARKQLGDVIVVGGHGPTVRRLGFKPASTFADAIEMARDVVATSDPTVTQLHLPPIFAVDVK